MLLRLITESLRIKINLLHSQHIKHLSERVLCILNLQAKEAKQKPYWEMEAIASAAQYRMMPAA